MYQDGGQGWKWFNWCTSLYRSKAVLGWSSKRVHSKPADVGWSNWYDSNTSFTKYEQQNKIRIYELWEKCQKFHAGLQHEIKKPDFRYNTSNTDHKWVALPPEQRYAVDKIPMSVVSGIYYTSDDNLWGPKMFTTRVWVTQAHSHSLSSASNGRDTARTDLCYFCGTGNIIFNVKKMVYPNNVWAYWHKKVWTDGKFCREWTMDYLKIVSD